MEEEIHFGTVEYRKMYQRLGEPHETELARCYRAAGKLHQLLAAVVLLNAPLLANISTKFRLHVVTKCVRKFRSSNNWLWLKKCCGKCIC